MERIKGKDVAFVLSAALFMAIVDVLFYLLIDGNPLKSLLILGANYMMALAFWAVLYLSSMIHLRRPFTSEAACISRRIIWPAFPAPISMMFVPEPVMPSPA